MKIQVLRKNEGGGGGLFVLNAMPVVYRRKIVFYYS